MEQSQVRDCVDRPFEIAQEASALGRYRAASYPMGSLEMNGAYPLNDEVIDEMVSRTSPGNYALGYMDGATFVVHYVGRSDSDVKRCLHEWVGAPGRTRGTRLPPRRRGDVVLRDTSPRAL
jgi:hypothetical protein